MGGHVLKALVVAPHPDDEVLGLGIWMRRHRDHEVHVVHVTDGSPLDVPDREAYAEVRKRELREALDQVPVPAARRVQLPFIDKETWRELVPLVEALDDLICRVEPDLVFAPAYEGGHPDHDAAAFAVAMVGRRRHFAAWEFPLYHAGENGDMITGEFAGGGGEAEKIVEPAPDEAEWKRGVLARFRSQAEFVQRFPVGSERIRPTPPHDFARPPHPGPLLYERWGWGIRGDLWRQLALEASNRISERPAFYRRRCPSTG